mmetsp:Transcript_13237/g.39174  ORF Transcript_13237/g.39174 Transcript_13237/m.39174 type:complete len:177 (+) Transcript_13237:953-1483(+)
MPAAAACRFVTTPYAPGPPYRQQTASLTLSKTVRSCSTTTTYVAPARRRASSAARTESARAAASTPSTRLRMACAAATRCLTSRKLEGSSNRYTSAATLRHRAIAKRCSSPPERACTSRSRTASRSSSSMISRHFPSSSLSSRHAPTVRPVNLRASDGSSWGFTTTRSRSSHKAVK